MPHTRPRRPRRPLARWAAAALAGIMALAAPASIACTGISLTSVQGDAIVGRTVEWALSDASHYRIGLFPRGRAQVGLTPEGQNGLRWTSRYGFLSMTAYGQDYGPDGMNEAGLYVGMYYLPGFADYAPFDPAQAGRSMSVGDFMQWMLGNFATVAELRTGLEAVARGELRVVNVEDPRFGGAPLPFHWKIADPSGESLVIEIVEGGTLKVYDAFLGVITNAPTYDWHLTNLRNYIGLSPAPRAPLTVDDLALSPLGSGSGMMGLPGDFTPPSRFVRAAALTASARPLADAGDAVFEAFRILDSFNIPLGATLPADALPGDITGATQITSVADLGGRKYYYHTMFNRAVRMIDLAKIDFGAIEAQILDDETGRGQTIRELRPAPPQ